MKLWRPTFKLLLVTLGDQGCKYYARVCFVWTNGYLIAACTPCVQINASLGYGFA
jgi:hypothetical protein